MELRRLIASALRRDGYAVIEAQDGVECLGYAQPWVFRGVPVEPPDVIISDVRMPGWSGLEVLDILRAGNAALPVILITGFGSHDTHDVAQRLGAAAIFDKPFDLDDLRGAVRSVAPA